MFQIRRFKQVASLFQGATTLLFVISVLITATVVTAQKGGNGGKTPISAEKGGGGGTPTPTPTPPPNPLPTTPPAPDILYRESFGEGPYRQRPSGGKGTMKSADIWQKLGGFWIEYPGSKNTQWMTLDTNQGWRMCSNSNVPNPYELYSPLQYYYTGEFDNGCVASGYDEATGISPTSLVPFAAPAVPYEISLDGFPVSFQGTYIAVGLTNSSILNNNLESTNSVALIVYPEPVMANLPYELKVGDTVVASGLVEDFTYNHMVLRVDPVQKTIGGSINGIEIGTFPADIGRPRYTGFEGIGFVDNFVVRRLE